MAAKVNEEACSGCETCVGACPVSAIAMDNGKAKVNEADCIECGACTYTCPARLPLTHAFRLGKQEVNNARMAAKAKAEAEAKAAAEKKEA